MIDHPGADTTEYIITTEIVRDEGIVVIPTADGLPEILSLHAPVEEFRVNYIAKRAGGAPTVPSPMTNDTNLALTNHIRTCAAPIMDTRTSFWQISGSYVYAIKKPIGNDTDFPSASHPYVTTNPDLNAIPRSKFVRTLVGRLPAPSKVQAANS